MTSFEVNVRPLQISRRPGDRRRLARNAYRAVYTVRFVAAVYVLHVFQKKAKSGIATPKQDMELIRKRLKAAEQVVKEFSR